MKKIAIIALVFFTSLTLFACKEVPVAQDVYYNVTFDIQGGSAVESQSIIEGGTVTKPADPTKEGFTFVYWYLDDSETEYQFSTLVTSDIVLVALWQEIIIIAEKTNEELIQEDITSLATSIYFSRYYVDTPSRGPINNSIITWTSTSQYVSRNGIVLPLMPEDDNASATLKARFSLNGTVVYHEFDVPLSHPDPVEITTEKVVSFHNLTTEYDVPDTDVSLLFEDDGSVPYIKVQDFFDLLTGFIDPSYQLTFQTDDTTLTVSYDYLDEEENQAYLLGESDFDGWYHLSMTVDTVENTITTPDPGFYWAYVYSTATNYGRHIMYDRNNEGSYYEDGGDLVYDLDNYNMDAVMYEGDAVLPYYIANQLFAGISYYNVYYNYDALYGIYSLPSYGTDEYDTIRSSSVNEESIPADLVAHTFNFLGFAFDEFYGPQEIMGVNDYYDLLFQKKDELLNDNASTFDDVLFNMIYQDFDEPHTSYGYPGYYNDNEYIGPRLTSLSQLGTRMNSFYVDGLYAVDDAIAARWNLNPTSWAAYDPDRPLYWFLDTNKTSVVLSLDDFNTSDIEESSIYDQSLLNAILELSSESIVPGFNDGNKYFYYNNSTQEYQLAEVLVKGLTNEYVDVYGANLEANGYVYDQDTLSYSKTINQNQYIVKIDFDTQFNLFYVGVLKLSADQLMADYIDVFAEDIATLVVADSAVYMEMYLELITNESTKLDTIILDLTFNTGGNVGALYRVLGFVTDQPFKVTSIDADTNSHSISYVYIDGVPNYSYLNWGLLQSPATFSAANEMSTIFKENSLGTIIGTQSGGGASSITPILLPNGSAFTMSSNSINGYAIETGDPENPYIFYSTEFGIEPDVELSLEFIYDSTQLMSIMHLPE